jgi:hypothetical protein
LVEPLEPRQLFSVSTDGGGPIVYPVTTPSTPTIVRLTTTYHGTAGSSSVTIHIDSFTHTGHFTATLTVVSSSTTITGEITGVVRANRHFTFTFTGTVSPGGGSASGTATGKVSPTGKTVNGIVVGQVDGRTFSSLLNLTRK